MTRRDVRRRVLQALNEDPDAPVFLTTGQVNQSLQEGFERYSEQSLALRHTLTIPRREGQMLYRIDTLDAQIQAPYRIWLPDLHRRLLSIELADLDAHHELWQQVHGDPYWWFPVDWRTFGVWPIPGNGGGWFELNFFRWPGALSDTEEIDGLLLNEQALLVAYGECEGAIRQSDVPRALGAWQRFTGVSHEARTNAEPGTYQGQTRVRGRRLETDGYSRS